MPRGQFRNSIATTVTAFPLADWQYETMQFDAQVQIGLKCDKNLVTATIYSGSDLLLDGGFITVGTVDTLPIFPDDFFEDVAAAGERLQVKVTNGNAATTIVYTVVNLIPI